MGMFGGGDVCSSYLKKAGLFACGMMLQRVGIDLTLYTQLQQCQLTSKSPNFALTLTSSHAEACCTVLLLSEPASIKRNNGIERLQCPS